VIAVCAALVLSLASATGANPAAAGAPLDNAARAKLGLLPRKVSRGPPASRARRIVVLRPAPTFLGEASGVEVDVSLVLRWAPR
jgi:hypothetical protein